MINSPSDLKINKPESLGRCVIKYFMSLDLFSYHFYSFKPFEPFREFIKKRKYGECPNFAPPPSKVWTPKFAGPFHDPTNTLQ